MSYLLIGAMFAPIVFFAFREKKWYLYLLMAFVPFLPEQMSVQLHDKLPLLTVSRVLIVVTAAFWLYQRVKERQFRPPVGILVFVGVNLLISLIHLPGDLDEIKRMFLLLLERGLVVVMLADLIADRKEFDRCVDFYILGSCVVALLGLVQTVFDYDVTQAIRWTKTASDVVLANRMGLTRAYGTMNAISFACYCAMALLPIYYRLESTRKQRYGCAFALVFLALIATFTRSAWLGVAGVMGILFLTRPVKMLRSLWFSGVLAVVLCLCLCAIQPKFGAALAETGKSVGNTVLSVLPEQWRPQLQGNSSQGQTKPSDAADPTAPTQTTQPTQPEISQDFGPNAGNPIYSRTFQWSAVKYMSQDGTLLLGNGYNALLQRQLRFRHRAWGDKWVVATFLDVGLVRVVGETGLLGLAALLGFLGYLLVLCIRRRDRNGTLDFYKLMLCVIPLYLLLNVMAAFLDPPAVWLLFGLLHSYRRLDQKGLLKTQDQPAKPETKFWQF